MSDKPINDGGPAFPCIVSNMRAPDLPNGHQVGNFEFQMYGMTLRDYFAAKAMAAFIASYPDGSAPSGPEHGWMIAEDAYEMADAMVKARNE